MPIYTKTGDQGETSLFGAVRIPKSSLQVEAYGSVDELTSFIGLVIAKLKDKGDKLFLTGIQKDLYKIMGCLAGASTQLDHLRSSVIKFEKKIDEMDKKLPKLTRFILPQGTELSGWFHILRTQSRKAERNIVAYFNNLKIKKLKIVNWTVSAGRQELKILIYLNRLSDLFFMMARYYNNRKEIIT